MTIAPWTTLDSTVTYRDQWLTVRSDRCLAANGAVIAPYHVLEYPDWVHVVAITSRQEIVLVRQYRHGAGVIATELPAGSIDHRDTGPETAALRELIEETGYTAERMLPVGRFHANPASQSNVVYAFLAPNAARRETPASTATEVTEVVLRPVADYWEGVQIGEFELQGLQLASLALAMRALRTLR